MGVERRAHASLLGFAALSANLPASARSLEQRLLQGFRAEYVQQGPATRKGRSLLWATAGAYRLL